jgi:DNA-binding transcriptional LysR family regulator
MSWQMSWRGVELRHLVALQAVAQERSFSAAAAKLGYTQSAISGQILSLERTIGARLFERIRGSRPVQLTPEGEILLAHASAISARLETAQVEIAALNGTRGALRLGTFQTVARILVPEAFSRLRMEDPAAELELHESYDLETLLSTLEHGKLDLAFTVLPTRDGPFETAEVYRDEHVLVCSRAHPLARSGVVALDELEQLPVIAVENCRAQSAAEIAIAAAGRPLRVERRLEDVASILAFVSAGLGVGFVPSLAVSELAPGLVAVPIDGLVPPRVIALAWHAERRLPPRAVRFVELAAAVGRTLRRPLLRAS